MIFRFLFGACCQLAQNEAIIDDYNKPVLNPLETFNGNDNHVAGTNGYGESDTILLETSHSTSPPKSSIYLSSHTPSQVYSPEIPTQVTSSITTFGTISSNKKKIQSTKQPYITKLTTPSKYGSTDTYILVQTLSNDKNNIAASSKPANVYDNEISSIESIILMLNDTKTGPQYNTDIKTQTTSGLPTKYGSSSSLLSSSPSSPTGSFYITTKLPASTTPNPIATLTTLFQKIPILTHNGLLTTKTPSTSYVYSTTIPKRPSPSTSNPNRIGSSTQTVAASSSTTNKKPVKIGGTNTNTKKPVQKTTTRPSTSYVSGPTPARPSYSPTKKPSIISSYTTPIKHQASEAPIINKIGSSTPAPTVIVLGPYGAGRFELASKNKWNECHVVPFNLLMRRFFYFYFQNYCIQCRFNGQSIANHSHYTKADGEFPVIEYIMDNP